MKVPDIQVTNAISRSQAARPQQSPSAANNELRVQDKVSVSDDVRKIQEVEEEKRIQEIKDQIDSGTYEIDLEKLAKAIINRQMS